MKTHRPLLRGGKPLLAWSFVLGLLFCGATAQQTYTRQATRVERVQMDTTFDNAGTATAVRVDAFLRNKLLINSTDGSDIVAGDWAKVSFDLLDANLTSTTISAAGKTVTYPQLAALLRQAALDRANAAGIQ